MSGSKQKPESSCTWEAQECSREDMEDASRAEAAYERFLASGEQAVPLEDVMREHGLKE